MNVFRQYSEVPEQKILLKCQMLIFSKHNMLQISSNFVISEVCNFLEDENPLEQKLPQNQNNLLYKE